MLPAARAGVRRRAIAEKNRLQRRAQDGNLTPEQSRALDLSRRILKEVETLRVEIPGTGMTFEEAQTRRAIVRNNIKVLQRSRASGGPQDVSLLALLKTELAGLNEVLANRQSTGNPRGPRPSSTASRRVTPTRITSVVSGGLPSLGGR